MKVPRSTFWLTRVVFLRALGLVYFVAFFSLMSQLGGLFGEGGLLPVGIFLERVHGYFDSNFAAFFRVPTVFLFGYSEGLMYGLCFFGVMLSVLLMFGVANVVILFLLWGIYMSFVNVGQLFYGYGWEIQLLETGFLAMFLCPLFNVSLLPKNAPSPFVVVLFYRWLIFRIMLGAGMIKMRGDSCWTDLTCLVYHYETQPIPNPLSLYFHSLQAA